MCGSNFQTLTAEPGEGVVLVTTVCAPSASVIITVGDPGAFGCDSSSLRKLGRPFCKGSGV